MNNNNSSDIIFTNSTSDLASSLSQGQEITLTLFTLLACTLSTIGSSTIIYKVVCNRRQAKSYDRLLLGLSIFDVLASIGYGLNPFLVPRESSTRFLAYGNDATCGWLGFMTQLAFAPSVYNTCLSYYFLLTIRFGMKRKTYAKRVEPWMHSIVFVFAFATSLTGWIMGLRHRIP